MNSILLVAGLLLQDKPESVVLKNGSNFVYLLPKDYSTERRWPVYLFLHGSEDRAEGIITLWDRELSRRHFILVAINSQDSRFWNDKGDREGIFETIQTLKSKLAVDPEQIWLGGFSAGGFMTYRTGLGSVQPFRGVVICGAGERGTPVDYSKAKNLATYILIGDQDRNLPLAEKANQGCKAAGFATLRYNVVKGMGHDITESCVQDVIEWMIGLSSQAGDGLKTEDGVRIAISYYSPKGVEEGKGSACILVPMLLRDRSTWAAFAEQASASGIGCLAIDPRGHGQSENPSGQAPDKWGKAQWSVVLKDVKAAKEFLIKKGFKDSRIFVIGASLGGSVALNYGAQDKAIAGVALLSATDNAQRMTVLDATGSYGKRPIFIASSRDDRPYNDVAHKLASAAQGEKTVREYEHAGHGTNMFGHEDTPGDLSKSLIDWIGKPAK